jgi:hypothetical protein
VRTKIVGGKNNDAIVDYRMRKGKDGTWRIIDVVIEGISLVANFRDQFREVIARGGPRRCSRSSRRRTPPRPRRPCARTRPRASRADRARRLHDRRGRDRAALVDALADDLLRLERELAWCPRTTLRGHAHGAHLQPARARCALRADPVHASVLPIVEGVLDAAA